MTRFMNKYRIESARLRGWDYAGFGWYYVTICVKDRACVFGTVAEGEMTLSEIGEIACQCWLEVPQHSNGPISLDEYVVMPDHIHGILVIDRRDVGRRDVACNVSTTNVSTMGTRTRMSDISPKAGSLGAIVRSFKSAVKRTCRVKHLAGFEWQERYFDHIIRTEAELERIRRYIVENPARWNPGSDTRQDLWM